MRIFLRIYSRANLEGDNGLLALILSQILLNCQQNLSSVQNLIFGLLDQVSGWVPGWAHEEYADAIYSVSCAPPTYSTDDLGDLSHSYLKIITINIKLRFKNRHKNFQGTIFFVPVLSAACAVYFTVRSNAVNTALRVP